MASIYELSGRFKELYQEIEDCDDEEFSALLKELAETEGGLMEKAEMYYRIIADAAAKSEGLKKESKKLRNRAERYDGIIERLRAAILFVMKQNDMVKLPTSLGTWSRRKNAAKVEIAYTDMIPEEYVRTVNIEYDKKKLKEALESGIEIDGVALINSEGVIFR